MAKYRKKPVVVEATQWFKDGDHPAIRAPKAGEIPGHWDGLCSQCGQYMSEHGWLSTLESGGGTQVACPGDYIITGVKGECYPCKPDIFEQTYESADLVPPRRVNVAVPYPCGAAKIVR